MRRMGLFSLGIIALMMIPVMLFSNGSIDSSAFELLRSTDQYIDVRFRLPQWEIKTEQVDGREIRKVVVDGASYLFIDEDETLPVFSTTLAIPYRGGAELQLTDVQSSSRNVGELGFSSILNAERAAGRYSAAVYPEQSVLVSEPKILRDYRVVMLNFMPFQYDQASGHLRISENATIRINLNNRSSINEMEAPELVSRSFESFYRGLILNYDEVSQRNQYYTAPRMLVVYGYSTDNIYLTKVSEYAAWKRQLGYQVTTYMAPTSATTTTIKTYIQGLYNNVETRPEYIVLIGDVGTSIQIPTFSSYVDYEYTWLAGSDTLGDAVIGRISVGTADEMNAYMSKLMLIERDLVAASATWQDRMVLVGDTASSGISTIYTNHYVRDVSSHEYPAYTYTEVYNGSPSSATINTAINQGVAFYNYRGYIGMSGWPSSIGSLINNSKPFHAVFITCATGNFYSGTSTTEQIVRAGTAIENKGAITAIGMATSSTHTPMNNCLNVGIFHGIYPLGMRNMGEAMLLGKLYLQQIYGNSNPSQALAFSQFCNLIGDPTALVYMGQPRVFNLTAPTSVAAGSSSVDVTVRDASNNLLSDAVVTLTNTAGMQVMAKTDASGRVIMNYPSATTGTLVLTVSKDDYKTLVQNITINTTGGIVYNSHTINDDTSGASSGNNNGVINGGETIEFYLNLRNSSTGSIAVNNAAISINDPYISLNTVTASFGTIAAGGTAQNAGAIVFSISPACPDMHQFILTLTSGTWNVPVLLTVRNGILSIGSITYTGAPGNVINPGDQYPMVISLSNNGAADLINVSAVLRSGDLYFEVVDSLGTFGTIAQGSSASNSGNSFVVHPRSICVDGMVIPMELILSNPAGYAQVIPFTVSLGNITVNDPLGQDKYGYFIFDQSDSGYTQCPSYDWIGISPAEGGSGTALTLYDPGASGDEGDQTSAQSIQTVSLPFAFTFYGQSYNQVSISSNGFIAMGATSNSDWRNWRLPGPGGANPMIAAFWDDLQINTGNAVYTYYDATNHYYVVQWNVTSGYDMTTPETFQAILYDPLYYPTQTGDGQIKLQYKVFNNIDEGSGDAHPHGNYSTIGIKNQDGTVGLEYTFNNVYPTAAAPLSNEKALFITTRQLLPETPFVVYEHTIILDENENAMLEPGELADLTIALGNNGLSTANNVSATLSSNDPYATILSAESNFGNIGSFGTANSIDYYGIEIASNCPGGHVLDLTLRVRADNGSWIYNVPLTVHLPALEFGDLTVLDASGNNNGILDPGETAFFDIILNNVGGVASPAGTGTISCNTPGISLPSNSVAFTSIPGFGSTSLRFTVQASSSMSEGTLATFNFGATAQSYTAAVSHGIEVGAPLQVVIGSGTQSQSYPIDRYYNYSVHESIYLASEILNAGSIKSLAYYKASGSDIAPIESVAIYMKHTTDTTLGSGVYNLAGYTSVYTGNYPNTDTSGWMEIDLNPRFEYNGTSNLAILIVKNHQQYINNYPMWTFTNTGNTRARQARSDSALPSSLTATANLPNLRFKIYASSTEVYLPPTNFTATASHRSVQLAWEAPAAGNPNSYKIYRNNNLLTTVTGLSYLDTGVTNGVSYAYFVKAIYGTNESPATETVTVIPQAIAPSNLTAVAGNQQVMLSWTAASGREELTNPALRSSESLFTERSQADRAISGYKVYRNGSALTTVTTTNYTDTGLTNGVTYSYYVTTIYSNPTGESAASSTVDATPTITLFTILGDGTAFTAANIMSPVNITYKSTHCQSVYTAAELNAAGVVGPIYITQLGFNIGSAPNLALVNFVVRMKHTSQSNATNWHDESSLQTVYSNPAYMPTAGGYDMLVFSQPFLWNGVDNILVDTANGLVAQWSQSGTLQYTSVTGGLRRTYSDQIDQTNVFTGGNSIINRPNIRISLLPMQTGPEIEIDPESLSFGSVPVNTTVNQQFTIENTGDQDLTGTITSPAGFTVTAGTRNADTETGLGSSLQRNTINYSIPANTSRSFNISFSPTSPVIVSGNVVVTSNDSNNPSINIAVSGTGSITSLPTPATVISQGTQGCNLNWNAIQYATSYKIYRSSEINGTFTLIATVTGTTYQDTNALERAFYKVIAVHTPPAR